jgi:hypothetical protein
MTDQGGRQVKQIALWKQIILHLAPGVVAVALFVLLNCLLSDDRIPSKLRWWQLLLFSTLSIGWVVIVCFSIGDLVNRFFYSRFFDWLPGYFQIGDILENPSLYSRRIRIITWLLALVLGSLLGPLVDTHPAAGHSADGVFHLVEEEHLYRDNRSLYVEFGERCTVGNPDPAGMNGIDSPRNELIDPFNPIAACRTAKDVVAEAAGGEIGAD